MSVRTPPAQTTYADSGDAGGSHSVQVTRNVPPKRVMVLPNNIVGYGGREYKDGESFVCGDGPVADQLAFAGHVVVVEHDATEAWNGEEGDATRKHALATIDAAHKAEGTKRHADHHHGFAKYEHADGKDATPVDVTQHRQQLAQRHMLREEQMEDSHAGIKKGGG